MGPCVNCIILAFLRNMIYACVDLVLVNVRGVGSGPWGEQKKNKRNLYFPHLFGSTHLTLIAGVLLSYRLARMSLHMLRAGAV